MKSLEQLIEEATHGYFLPESARASLELAGVLLQQHEGEIEIILRKRRMDDGRYRLFVIVTTDQA